LDVMLEPFRVFVGDVAGADRLAFAVQPDEVQAVAAVFLAVQRCHDGSFLGTLAARGAGFPVPARTTRRAKAGVTLPRGSRVFHFVSSSRSTREPCRAHTARGDRSAHA